MGRIVHLALKVDEIEKTGEFYTKVFGFQDAETTKTRDHISRHMTDGEIDFTLLRYDAGTPSAESKAAGEGPCIHHFAVEVEISKRLAHELAPDGITVNCVAPGMIDTVRHAASSTATPDHRRRHHTLLARHGTAWEVAQTVVWLAGDGARFVTGQVIHINGGAYLGG
jgi:NAD(P)-dependent dehydrogenase (short-subunit alcohol dehydrogenase family)